jgi:DNA adenine methylase
LLSNSATDFIKKLYENDYKVETVEVPRMINSDSSKRGKIDEVLIRNYELQN